MNRESGEKAGKHHQQQQQKETRLSSCFTSTPLEQKMQELTAVVMAGRLPKKKSTGESSFFSFKLIKRSKDRSVLRKRGTTQSRNNKDAVAQLSFHFPSL